MEIKIKGYKCERCGYEWTPRNKKEIPISCPKCKSPYWNKKRVRKFKEGGECKIQQLALLYVYLF